METDVCMGIENKGLIYGIRLGHRQIAVKTANEKQRAFQIRRNVTDTCRFPFCYLLH